MSLTETPSPFLAFIRPDRFKLRESQAMTTTRSPTDPNRVALKEHNLHLCEGCDHFNNDVNSGEPLNPPCGLNRALTICAWKRSAASGEKQGDDCLWIKEIKDDVEDR